MFNTIKTKQLATRINRLLAALVFLIIQQTAAIAQCPELDAAMVNSCGANEGANEFFIFTTKMPNIVSAYNCYYNLNSPPNAGGSKVLAGAAASVKSGSGNINSLCCKVKEITSSADFIPANSRVMFIPSVFDCIYNISSLCISDTIYVVYINASNPLCSWNVTGGGNIANYPTNRYLQVVDITNNCASAVQSYDASIWPANSDGNAVFWDNTGSPTGVNNGCDFGPAGPAMLYTNPAICIGTLSINIPFTLIGCPNQYSITWDAAALSVGFNNIPLSNFSSTSLMISIPLNTPTGVYNANVYVENSLSGVGSTQPLSITINPLPTVSLPLSLSVCNNEKVLAISLTPNPANASIAWTNDNTAIGLSSFGSGNIPSFIAKNTTSIPQIAQISLVPSINGCVGNSSNFTITVQPSKVPLFTVPSSICYGSTIVLPSVSTNGIMGTWAPDVNSNQTTTYLFTPLSNQGACVISTTTTVAVHQIIPDAGKDQNVVVGQPFQLNASGGLNNLMYEWSPSGVLNNPYVATPVAVLTEDTKFHVMIKDSAGCQGIDSVTIKVYKDLGFYFPKAFSPNGDGLNDVFKPIAVSVSSIEYFKIYNRFGNIVFETTAFNKGWDGYYKNKRQNTDTYVYVIKGTTLEGKELIYKGSFLLIN